MTTVTFTVHQRPFYLRETLDSWREVRGIKGAHVQFHVDPSTQLEPVTEIVTEFAKWHGDTDIHLHARQLGVAENPFHALTEAFRNDDFAVLAEEDVEVSQDVLEYFEYAQVRMAFDHQLMAACAWSDAEDEPNKTSLRQWFNPWLWGTTRDMWDFCIRPTWDHDYSTGDESGPAGWDCNLGLRVVKSLSFSVLFPGQTRSRHIGKHLGVHQDPSKYGAVEDPPSFTRERPQVNWKDWN